ncbi:MAG TPA: Uma2 family endonuclease [Ilumatobacter sp.]|jgi:Uma2 family endonuclease|nr:Uma2 family endonuclease [Ilumatobacter sp.]
MSVISTWPDTGLRHRVSVAEFGRMAEADVFDPEARLELVDGEILEMSPIKEPHAYAVDALTMLLGEQLGRRGVLRVQSSIVCGEYSQPQPDVAVLAPPITRYRTRHPGVDDILLLIEVADATLRFDRQVKVPIYSREGIREAWLVDIPNRRVEVFRQPTPDGYASATAHHLGSVISPTAFPEVEIAVAELVPER